VALNLSKELSFVGATGPKSRSVPSSAETPTEEGSEHDLLTPASLIKPQSA